MPTTLIGLIDASVVDQGRASTTSKLKNRLGAFHASQKVILDFSFLKTLPEDQIRNGMAEIIKIAVVGNKQSIFDLLEEPRRAAARAPASDMSGGTPGGP